MRLRAAADSTINSRAWFQRAQAPRDSSKLCRRCHGEQEWLCQSPLRERRARKLMETIVVRLATSKTLGMIGQAQPSHNVALRDLERLRSLLPDVLRCSAHI
jgi:hypothetical protein